MDSNKHLENPFLTRGFLKDEWFCDRETETEKLLSNALNGVDTTLISPRKYGKTGLIFHLFHRIEAENLPIKCIYVDLFHTRSLEDFVKTLADELIKFPPHTTFGQRVLDFIKRLRPVLSYDSLTGDPQVSFTYQLEAEKEQNLKNILDFLNSQPEQIILAMDEFQQVTEYPENMEALLRAHIQNLHNIRFIFSGSSQALMAEMFMSPKRPLFSQTQQLHLDKISEDKYAAFIKKLFNDGGMQIEEEVIRFILEWTRRHTFYTQSLCNKVYSKHQSFVDLETVKLACCELLDENENSYIQYRELLTGPQWKILTALAKEQHVEQITSSAFLQKYHISGTTTARRTIQSLIDKGLVLATPGKTQTVYEVYDVFFMHWLAREY
jgi:hypothetical protein